jgi:hypothetical protein
MASTDRDERAIGVTLMQRAGDVRQPGADREDLDGGRPRAQ